MDKLQWFSIHSIFESLRSHVDYPRFIHGWMITSRMWNSPHFYYYAVPFSKLPFFEELQGKNSTFSLSLSLFNLVTIYCRSMKNRQFRIPKPNTLWKNSGSSTMPLSDVGINRRIERYSKSSLPRNIQIVRTKPVKPYETIRFRNVAVKVNCALATIFRERQRPSIEEEGGKKGKNAFSYRGGCFCYEFLPLSSTVVQRLARYRKGHV